jgi:hypothetical protein
VAVLGRQANNPTIDQRWDDVTCIKVEPAPSASLTSSSNAVPVVLRTMPDARRGSTASRLENAKLYPRRGRAGSPVRVLSENYKLVLRDTWTRFATSHRLPVFTVGDDAEIGYVLENVYGSPLFEELKERYPARAETLTKEWIEALLAIGTSDKDMELLTPEEIQQKDDWMMRYGFGSRKRPES